ncbi:TetR/AcrR family transcriptional regulator [Phenylobacterium sp.]|uniref:TetR/AcrR family transcriptional regulator n=1 Tax=Phenylobacterium sp. TaxID=1871053 RepID=UPI00289A4C74|nr:TetR/AcrR family transcriptional regulator [Phenylobacterium sp.]
MTLAPDRRPVGRPRGDGRPHLTRDEVFLTAARLISAEGYTGASIRMIAQALQVAPASLFNLFGAKDALLNELVVYLAQPSLDFYARLNALALAPEVALFKSLFEEAALVASVDRALPAIFYLPELQKPQFEPAQRARAALVAHYRGLIEAGCESGALECDLPGLAAEQMLQLSETSVLAALPAPPLAQARASARLALRALLADRGRLEAIEAQAAQVDLTIL